MNEYEWSLLQPCDVIITLLLPINLEKLNLIDPNFTNWILKMKSP